MHGQHGDAPSADKVPLRKKLLFFFVIYFLFLLGGEAGARIVFFLKEDLNPYYLTFGFVPDIERHSANFSGYTKFQPSSTYHFKVDRVRTINMQINSDGFRGLYDFVKPKPAGVFRVAALGASSTFGLHDEDNETYPYLLEQQLRSLYPGMRIEVLNLGIPHFLSYPIPYVPKYRFHISLPQMTHETALLVDG